MLYLIRKPMFQLLLISMTTANGTDDETDEELRERIRLAPSQFSVAGPTGAYKFFAKSAHPSIVDVSVTIGHDPVTSANTWAGGYIPTDGRWKCTFHAHH
jgi:hypothetical protein